MGKKSKKKKTSRKTPAKSSNSKKMRIVVLAVILVAVGSYFLFFKNDRNPYANRPDNTPIDINALKGGETRPTLSPVAFVGNVARAYDVARKNRELLDSMYCYCNCKKHFGHKSLLTCFVDKHAAECKICMDQAFYAESRFNEGMDIAPVRYAVDKKFWRPLS